MPSTPQELVLTPFRALRYDQARIGDLSAVLCPPYDVIDEAGVERYEAAHPNNAVRLILPRGDEEGPDSKYRHAAAMLADWRSQGVLVPDTAPALYVYEESVGGHTQRGLVGGLGLVPFDAGIVLPHENVMPGPVADRLALMAATDANLEPIFLVYDGGGPAAEIVGSTAQREPLIDVTTDDAVSHRIWAVTDPTELDAIAADLAPRQAVIADGHHRYTTYLHLQEQHRAEGSGPWDYGLTLLADTSTFGPQVHAIHRVIRSLDVATAAKYAESAFTVRRIDGGVGAGLDALADAGASGPAYLIAGPDQAYLLTEPTSEALDRAVPADRSPAWRGLDVTIAHHLLISDLWRMPDNVDTVGYAHDVDEALAMAKAADGTALLLNPTPVDAVAAVAIAGDRMPRKSTLFTPKPRTGLLIRTFDLG
ncbi:MAG: hypothetical protein QOG53_2802 [Frankiales bacterium]|jgi:uncharacterized protein (DUF1015 family)|nr:hypothetical protein [Frankiales bacterium]